MASPKVSVIIAAYNHQDYIAQTLKSLEGQTFQDFEVILIDDGSTDNTIAAAKGVTSRAQIFTQQNRGVVAALNRGVALAKGEYICLVDSDDVVLSDRFARQVDVLDNRPQTGLVFADALIIDSRGRQIGIFSDVYPVVEGDTAQQLVRHYCFIPTQTVMVRKDLLKETGPFERPGAICDYMKWIEAAHLSAVYYDSKPLACWRRHKGSVSINVNREKTYAQTRIGLKKVLRKYPRLQSQVATGIRKRFSSTYLLTAVRLAAKGDIKRAKKYYCKAVKVYPGSLPNWCGLLLTGFLPEHFAVNLHRYVLCRKLPW